MANVEDVLLGLYLDASGRGPEAFPPGLARLAEHLVAAACRTDVARRCKQSGMHRRFLNAAALCALAARFRSRLPAA